VGALIFHQILLGTAFLAPRFVRRTPRHIHDLGPLLLVEHDTVTENSVVTEIGDENEVATDISLTLNQLKPFLDIAVPFFKTDDVARRSLIGVFAMTLLNSGISVVFSFVSRDFYNALNARNEALFYEKVEYFFLAILVAIPVSVYYRFLREKLSLYWREALTSKMLDKYYADRTYYVIEMMREIDNPDQRITEDVRAFTRTSLDFFISIFTAIIDLVSFAAILYQIYPGLFWAIIVYAGGGSYMTTRLGKDLVSKNYNKFKREADFRFSLIRTRENAEAIAFYDPEANLEQASLWKTFKLVLDTQLDIVKIQRNLEVFTTGYRYLPQILPSLIVAPLYFQGKIEIGSITQSYSAFNHVLSDFSLIINSFEQLSAFSAGLNRLTSFFDAISIGGWETTIKKPVSDSLLTIGEEDKDDVSDRQDTDQHFITMKYETPSLELKQTELMRCTNLGVFTPDGSRVIIGSGEDQGGGLDISMNKGDKIILVGNSGCGKSTLVRAISGLWQRGYGEIVWNEDLHVVRERHCVVGEEETEIENTKLNSAPSEVFFLPQRPYNVLGSLRDQIMYPTSINKMVVGVSGEDDDLPPPSTENNDEELLRLLDKVRLPELAEKVGGLDKKLDWSKVLSLGEQQRLAFARILYNTPQVVVMDESTSALDLTSEKAMYKLLDDMDISYISIGHRPSLLKYHNKKIFLPGSGQPAQTSNIDIEDALTAAALY
jgi:vitamin B12/bleomycin/antimicrobial peptide transport system ATP-binding/permease protein